MSTRVNGGKAAMRAWFEQNPTEFLTFEDCKERFGFQTLEGAKQAFYALKREGILCAEHMVHVNPERPRF